MWAIKWLLLALIYLLTNSKIKTAKNPLLVYIAIFITFFGTILFFSFFGTIVVSLGTELESDSLISIGQLIIELTTFHLYY